MSDAARADAFRWVEENHARWSAWNAHIWHLAETAWREYRSAEWYVKTLRGRGGFGGHAHGVLRHMVERAGPHHHGLCRI